MAAEFDTVIIGAGLAGLTAAGVLHAAGRHVVVLEAGDAVGGRVRTDVVDGMLLDRGFQLLNPAYPRARTTLDLAALQLRQFGPGAVVAHGGGRVVVADPRRSPRDIVSTLRMPFGTLRQKLAFVRWAAEIGFGPAARIKSRPDAAFEDELHRRAMAGGLVESVLRPFLAGVLADGDLVTSRRLVELLVRSFIRGTPGVPAAGMQAIPAQLAARLPAGTVRLSTPARAITGPRVMTDDGEITGRAVIVATDAPAAHALTALQTPPMRSLTTFYHLAPSSPANRPMLHLDGDRRGPLVNTAVMTDTAPGYAPGRTLIASTVLGADASGEMERQVRRHAATIYGSDTGGWEHVATYPILDALPETPAGTPIRRPVELGDGLFVAGDHRDTASLQGALVSGHRAAAAVARQLG